jgi:hypothetical protein
VTFFQAALAKLKLPPATVVPYAELLCGGWSCCDEIRTGDLVRIESPGENADVEAALVQRGANAATPEIEHGRIFQPQRWYAGYCDLLAEIERRCAPRDAQWMNAPADIAAMFDKTQCQRRLAKNGLPVPPALHPIHSYEELRESMRQSGESRVFVKLRHGSSASGVVALRFGGARVSATTSVEMIGTGDDRKLFNSLKLRRYTSEDDVAALIDALARFEVHVERWIPKATWQGKSFDLRVMVICGAVRHVVMRCSRSPLTNLHLGNQRGDVEQFLRTVDPVAVENAWNSCRGVAEVFPDSLYFGIDLLFTPDFRQHYVMEVNAFGDLLPDVLLAGDDTYTAEIKACLPAETMLASRRTASY